MDLSKLPRMSNTPTPPPQAAPTTPPVPAAVPVQPQARPAAAQPPADSPIGIGAEIWFMTIVGLVLILFGRGIIGYEFSRMTHQSYHTTVTWETGDKAGEEVAYPDLISGIPGGTFYTDLCLVLFGLTLIVDAVGRGLAGTRLPGGQLIMGFTLAVTLLMVGYNFHVAAKYFHAGSLPIVSCLAIAFGGYLALFQFSMMKSLRGPANDRA